jgi:cathepsin L
MMVARLTLALICMASTTFAAPTGVKTTTADVLARLNYEYTFDQYTAEFSKVYESEPTRKVAEAAFLSNLEKIKQHNSQLPAPSWFMGVNDYADMTAAEFKSQKMGRSKSIAFQHNDLTTEEKAAFETAHAHDVPVADLPDSIDWRTKGVVTPVKNQGGCGSCWAFSTAETIESHLAVQTGKLLELSEQEFVDCVPNPNKCGGTGGCDGATQWLGFLYASQNGVTTESDYAYTAQTGKCDHNKLKPVANITSYVRLPQNNYSALMNAVTKQPIAISAAAEPWQLYEHGVFDKNCGTDVDHAIQLVGYGTNDGVFKKEDYWLVRNSWGGSWGEKGYIRIKRDGATGKVPCAPDTKPDDGTACAGGPSSISVCGVCGILSDSSYPTGGSIYPSAAEL